MRDMDLSDWVMLALFGVGLGLVGFISVAAWNQHKANVRLDQQPHRITAYWDSPSVQILTDTKTGVEYMLFDGKVMVRLDGRRDVENP